MTFLLLTFWRHLYDEIVVLFANTGEENEETLQFVKRCDEEMFAPLGARVVWVEAAVHPQRRKGTTFRVVNFESASRHGEPYEEVIKKYGIPNQKFPHCTRELKQHPMVAYVRLIGWKKGTYDVAIGIRADEPDRRASAHEKKRIVYPLLDWLPMSKPDVNAFWMSRPFRLNLMGYQGNCKWCWKKTLRKLLTIMADNPEAFDFPERMEALYGTVGAEFRKEKKPKYSQRVFFRRSLSTKDLRAVYEAKKDTLDRAQDDAVILPSGEKVDLDDAQFKGCQESCEIDFESFL